MTTYLVWQDGGERSMAERIDAPNERRAAEDFVRDFCCPDDWDSVEVFVSVEGGVTKQVTVDVETETYFCATESRMVSDG